MDRDGGIGKQQKAQDVATLRRAMQPKGISRRHQYPKRNGACHLLSVHQNSSKRDFLGLTKPHRGRGNAPGKAGYMDRIYFSNSKTDMAKYRLDKRKELEIKEEIDFHLTVDIDCYNCGENITIPFRLGVHHAEYGYCNACGEGIEIRNQAHTLSISRLEPLTEI